MRTPTADNAIILRSGRDYPVRKGHPWIFRGSIEHLPDAIANGDIASIHTTDGEWIAYGYVNRTSQITVRLLSWRSDEVIDETFWRNRLQRAISLREELFAGVTTTTYRLVNAESDFLPGLTVDRYGPYLVMQVGTLAIDLRKQTLANMLLELTGCVGVLERSALAVRQHEGLTDSTGVLAGVVDDAGVIVQEHGLHFHVDLWHGQKTGFFTDQRDNRRHVAMHCRDRRVLNAFSYTGAFAVYALAAGAQHVTNIDSSIGALQMAEENLRLNGFDPDAQTENIAGDVFDILREWRSTEGSPQFDAIILDPPKFAQTKGHIERALRGYKEINLSALHILKPGGILATFSCSGLINSEAWQQAVFQAAADVHRPLQILAWLRQGSDHPVAATFPEGEYLKGIICRML